MSGKTPTENFAAYLRSAVLEAQRAIDRETIAHEKRTEFWRGYKAAMEEVRDHPETWPTPPEAP